MNILLSAIYRYPKEISGFLGSCIVKTSPEIFTFIFRALHHGCEGAPSTDIRLRSLSNELALDTWSHMSSMRRQKYTLIFAAPSIVVAFMLFQCAIYRYPKTISGFFGSCIVKTSPEIFTFIFRALHHGCEGAPSTDVRLRSLSNELALDIWSHMSSMRRQKYSQIFAASSIVVAFMWFQRAIYRYPKENTI